MPRPTWSSVTRWSWPERWPALDDLDPVILGVRGQDGTLGALAGSLGLTLVQTIASVRLT